MKYLNQLQYEDMPYPTDTDHPGSDFQVNGTVKRAGCGLCSVCMVVERLSLEPFSLKDCRDLAMQIGANHAIGTDMKILAPAVAQRFDLDLEMSDDPARLADCLRQGGAAVVHVGGDREGYVGTFSNGGHYIAAISVGGDEFCLLDPSWTAEKYTNEPRRSRVRQNDVWLYATAEVLQDATANRTPGYYLFTRRADRP